MHGQLPLPGSAPHEVAAPAPGAGPGFWSGSSTAALEPDGSYAIAYRVRNGHEGNALNVIARSEDGASLTTVAELDEARFGAMSIERPALVRTDDGRWRMYVCLATPGASTGGSARWRPATSRGWPPPTSGPRSPATRRSASRTR